MTLVLGNRRITTVAKLALIAALALAISFIGSLALGSNAQAAVVVKPATCDAAIGQMNKSLVLVAKRRIQSRTAKKQGAKKYKRAKRNLKNAQKQANAARASIKALCIGSGGVSAQDAQCTLTINSLAKSIELKYTRTLRYKKLKVKGKTKKARKQAAKRKRAMKTQLKKLDDQIKAQTESFKKTCGGSGDTGNGGGGDGEGADTTPPGAVIVDGPDGPTNDPTPTVEITTPETGGHIECRIDGGAWFTVTSPWTLPALSEGTHTITCRYVDGSGNAGEETSITITVDTTAPGGVTVNGPSGPTSDTTPTVTITTPETGGHIECKIDDGEWVTVTSPWTLPALSEGTHTITCRYVDAAGNAGDESSITITIDTTAPGAVTIDGPDGPTNDDTPTVELSIGETGGHFECKIDDGAFQTVPASWTLPALADGTHTITCRYVDAAGNTGSETVATITIDTVAPGPVLIDGPNGPTSDTTPGFNLSGAGEGEHYECKVDGGEYAPTGALFVTEELSEGTHAVTCRLVDEAGNAGPGSTTSVTIDSEAPGSVTIDGPDGPTNDTTPTLTLTSNETGGHFECRVDGGSWQTVTSPWTLPALSEGEHIVTCRYVDAANNAGAESSIVITIDTTAPGAPNVSGPNGPTSDTTPSYVVSGGGSDVASYQCKIDGGSFATVPAAFTTGALSEGVHTVTCHATDTAGNVGPNTVVNVTVDTTAPGAITLSGPSGATNDNTPTYTISGGGSDVAGYQCKVDGGAFVNVTSPFTTAALADGAHVVTCRAVDAAGNAGAESSKSITVDTVAPGAVTISGPSGAINDDTPTYTLTGAGSGEHYECKTNGGSYATVTSPYTTAALGQGVNTITCRVVDAAGNAGATSSVSVTVDSIGPAITVADGAPRWDGTHAFTLGGEAGTTFKCKIDGGAYATVSANYVTAVLSNGSHTITCYGIDAAGNSGATVTKSFGVFKDPVVVTKGGGFQWGLGCTLSSFMNALLGCPDNGLSVTIPANPNGLTGNYLVDLSGVVNNLTSGLSFGSTYKMYIVVDGVAVAGDTETVPFDILGICGVDLAASKTSLSLSAASAHTIQLTLKTSALISVFPSVQSSSLSVSIHH